MHTFSGTPARRMFRAAVLRKSWKSFPFKLAFLSFSLQDTLEGIRSQHFPAIASAPNAYFVYHGPLACTWIDSEKSAIYIHAILNHQETPLYVISLICKHELLHHQIVPREINGLRQQHPPEFWEAEKAIAPERDQAWGWIWETRWNWLKPRPRLERIDVRRNWREVWNWDPTATIEKVVSEVVRKQLNTAKW